MVRLCTASEGINSLRRQSPIRIVGGGIQGCFLAIALQEDYGIRAERISIYDENPLLHNWFRYTRACAMRYLRSNSSHSLHPRFNHLREFAQERGIDPWNSPQFAQPYHRPSIELFNEHARYCLERYVLRERQVFKRVQALRPQGLLVDGQELEGIVFYTAHSASFNIPIWGRSLGSDVDSEAEQARAQAGAEPLAGSRWISHAHHVFSEYILGLEGDIPAGSTIVGGGISAVQCAIDQAEKGKVPHLLSRHPLRALRFDFNPCYVGRDCQEKLNVFESAQLQGRWQGQSQETLQLEITEDNAEKRMKTILANRYSGTVPAEVLGRFQELRTHKALRFSLCTQEAELLRKASASPLTILCTGFSHTEDETLKTLAPRFVQGYPVIDNSLRIANAVFVSGTNAMYRVGPAAPNIIGAQLAWRRIQLGLSQLLPV